MTEIAIEIKQSYPGPMASNPIIESHRMCKVFPVNNDFLIENGHFRLKHKRNHRESFENFDDYFSQIPLCVLAFSVNMCKGVYPQSDNSL